MSQIIELNEDGALYVPPELLGEHASPRARYVLEIYGKTLVLRPDHDKPPFWSTATPEEWVQAFHQWVSSHKEGPGLPDEALRREQMYD